MKNEVCCSLKFDKVFDEWVHNHFYEPDYRKEPAMKKPAHKHVDVITRAQHLLETGTNVHDNPRLVKSIQDDIVLLGEVRKLLYELIEKPPLPFTEAYDDPKEPLLNPIEDEPDEAD